MKQTIILLFALNSQLLMAQTGLIAHKSHSGSSAEYDPNMLSNFGETPEMHLQHLNPKYLIAKEDFKRLNDTTIVYTRLNLEDSIMELDTLKHQKNVPDSVLKTSYSILKEDLSTPIPVVKKEKKKKNRKASVLWISILASFGFIISKALLDKTNRTKTA